MNTPGAVSVDANVNEPVKPTHSYLSVFRNTMRLISGCPDQDPHYRF